MPVSADAAQVGGASRRAGNGDEVGAVGCAWLLLDLALWMAAVGYNLIMGLAYALSPTTGKARKELLGPEERDREKL